MNEANFLKRVGYLVPGDGFRKVEDVKLSDIRTSAGLVLTAATDPVVAAMETNYVGYGSVAGSRTLGMFQFVIPEDYDDSDRATAEDVGQELRIRLLANMSGSTDSPAVYATIYSKHPGVALVQAAYLVKSDTILASNPEAQWVECNCDQTALAPGDAVCVFLGTDTHATDAILVYGIEVYYRSNLAFTYIDTVETPNGNQR